MHRNGCSYEKQCDISVTRFTWIMIQNVHVCYSNGYKLSWYEYHLPVRHIWSASTQFEQRWRLQSCNPHHLKKTQLNCWKSSHIPITWHAFDTCTYYSMYITHESLFVILNNAILHKCKLIRIFTFWLLNSMWNSTAFNIHAITLSVTLISMKQYIFNMYSFDFWSVQG